MMAQTPSHNDADLIRRLQAGEDQAFKSLFDRYYRYLVVTVFNVLGDRDKARDLAQDVFYELWKRKAQIQIQSSLKSYLRRAAINKTLNYIKAQRLDFSEPEVFQQEKLSQTASAQEQLEADDLQQLINTAIEKLPEKCRLVFSLCRLEGLSHKEIAAKLNISVKTVENQMTKAMKVLRSVIQPHISRNLCYLLLWFFG